MTIKSGIWILTFKKSEYEHTEEKEGQKGNKWQMYIGDSGNGSSNTTAEVFRILRK